MSAPLPLPPHPAAERLRARAIRHEAPGGERGALWHEWGEGAPIVLLHGGSGSWTHWVANIERLAETHRVLCADLPGCGGSPEFEPGRTSEEMAEILRRGLAALVPQGRYGVAAFSFSALVAAHMARDEGPERMTRLVMLGPARFGGWSSLRGGLRRWRGAESPEAEAEAHRENLRLLMLRDGSAISPETVRLQAENARAMRLRLHSVGDLGPVEEVLEDVRVPLAGIWGEFDAIAGDMEASRASLHRFDPDAPFHVLPGAGHWVMFEAAETVDALLAELLAD